MHHWCLQERPQPSPHLLQCKQQQVQEQQQVLRLLQQQQVSAPRAHLPLAVLLQQLAHQKPARGRPLRCLLQCCRQWPQVSRQVPRLLGQRREQWRRPRQPWQLLAVPTRQPPLLLSPAC